MKNATLAAQEQAKAPSLSFMGGGSAKNDSSMITQEERKQAIFALDLSLSSPKIQENILAVRKMHRTCAVNRAEKEPNKLVDIKVYTGCERKHQKPAAIRQQPRHGRAFVFYYVSGSDDGRY